MTDTVGRMPLISHEDLLGYPIYGRYYGEAVVRRIAETFPEGRVLVLIREQASMLLSNYFQYIRQGGTSDLKIMLGGDVERPGFRPIFRLDHFEYDLTYNVLRKHFDSSQILMLPMELLKCDRNDFMRRLSAFCGFDLSHNAHEKTVHASRCVIAAFLERSLNRVIPNPSTLPNDYKDYPLRVRARNRIVKNFEVFARMKILNDRILEKSRVAIEDHMGDYFVSSNERTSELTKIKLSSYGY